MAVARRSVYVFTERFKLLSNQTPLRMQVGCKKRLFKDGAY